MGSLLENLEKYGKIVFPGGYGWIEEIQHGRIWPNGSIGLMCSRLNVSCPHAVMVPEYPSMVLSAGPGSLDPE